MKTKVIEKVITEEGKVDLDALIQASPEERSEFLTCIEILMKATQKKQNQGGNNAKK